MGGNLSRFATPSSRICELAGRFARDERGVTAVIFGIMFTFMLLVAAIALDYTRATREMLQQQAALDAAVLAASHSLGLDDEDVVGQARAEAMFAANMPEGSTATIAVNLDNAAGEVTGVAANALPTTLLKSHALGAARRDHLDIGTRSRVVKGDGTVEIALVVDNSGSMASYLADLKTAATNLTTKVFAGADGDEVKVGMVPFAASVNVGSAYAGASWMDTEAVSTTHSENFVETKSRFDLFDDLGQTWGGCVEARPSPYETNDAAPTDATPDTLFVPMFAPDEPDDANASAAGHSNYANNYISDYEGTCPEPEQVCLVYNSKKKKCTSWGPETLLVADAQKRVCKYSGAAIIDGTGPNFGCTTPAILPLTATQATVTTAINSLLASGNTNIGEGTTWGWRVLSPSQPFTDGRAYSDTENRKVLVVMTDGANTYTATSNHNKSRYGAFGYSVYDRLGTTYTSAAYSDAMDVKLNTACTNAKAEGITIYTVAFRLESDPDTQALLKACATDEDHYYAASGSSALIQAFEDIGQDISNLRLAG